MFNWMQQFTCRHHFIQIGTDYVDKGEEAYCLKTEVCCKCHKVRTTFYPLQGKL